MIQGVYVCVCVCFQLPRIYDKIWNLNIHNMWSHACMKVRHFKPRPITCYNVRVSVCDCTYGRVTEKETERTPREQTGDIQMKGELMKTTCHIFSPALSRNRKWRSAHLGGCRPCSACHCPVTGLCKNGRQWYMHSVITAHSFPSIIYTCARTHTYLLIYYSGVVCDFLL